MKSKSFQSLEHNNSFLSDEKINDNIFIEESHRFRLFNKKMIVDSKETLPIIAGRNNNNNNNKSNNNNNNTASDFLINSHENQLKYNFVVSSNPNYQDPHLLAVYSTTNNKVPSSHIQPNPQLLSNSKNQISTTVHRLKTNSPLPANNQNNQNAYLLNSAPKPINLIDRSSSFSKYQQVGNGSVGNSSPTYNRKLNAQLANDYKKYTTNSIIQTSQNNTKTSFPQQQQTNGSPIISILNKPIFSNIFILNSNTPNNANKTNDYHRITNRSNKITTDLNTTDTNNKQQPSPHQQNFYNLTSNNIKSITQIDAAVTKQSTTKEKTNLSNYFTNLLSQNNAAAAAAASSSQQQLSAGKKFFNQTKQNGRTSPVKNLSRNDTNVSNLSNYNYNNSSNLSMILALNKFNSLKHTNTFNYKLNSHQFHQSTPTTTPTGTITDNEIISRMLRTTTTTSTSHPKNDATNTTVKYYDTTIQEIDNINDEKLMAVDDADNLIKNNNTRLQLKTNENRQNILRMVNQNNKRQTPVDDLEDAVMNYEQVNDEQQKTKLLHSILHKENAQNKPDLLKQQTSVQQQQQQQQQQQLGNKSSTQKRSNSARTYISRDINDSYAYNDVKKYIEENDLMSPEKAEFIKLWVKNVNLYLKDLEQTVT